jgi:hypothetical protein
MPEQVGPHHAGVRNHPGWIICLKQAALQPKDGSVKGVRNLPQPRLETQGACPSLEPRPVTTVTGPEHIGPRGPVEAQHYLGCQPASRTHCSQAEGEHPESLWTWKDAHRMLAHPHRQLRRPSLRHNGHRVTARRKLAGEPRHRLLGATTRRIPATDQADPHH